jgi:hypothetical protein
MGAHSLAKSLPLYRRAANANDKRSFRHFGANSNSSTNRPLASPALIWLLMRMVIGCPVRRHFPSVRVMTGQTVSRNFRALTLCACLGACISQSPMRYPIRAHFLPIIGRYLFIPPLSPLVIPFFHGLTTRTSFSKASRLPSLARSLSLRQWGLPHLAVASVRSPS